jgi:hypothetical protein
LFIFEKDVEIRTIREASAMAASRGASSGAMVCRLWSEIRTIRGKLAAKGSARNVEKTYICTGSTTVFDIALLLQI